MKIIIIYEYNGFDFRNRFSAVATVLLSIGELLNEQGHTIFLNEHEYSDLIRPISKTNYVDFQKKIKYGKIIRLFPSFLREIYKDIAIYVGQFKLFLKLRKIDCPDLILSWTVYGGRYCARLSETWNIPLVSIFDNPIADEYTFLKGFKPFFSNWVESSERICIENSAALIVYSPEVEKFILDKYRFNCRFYFKSFCDFQRNTKAEYDLKLVDKLSLKIIYIGSFFGWHNVDVLIAVFETIAAKNKDVELILVGNGPEHARMTKLVNSSDFASRIQMPGLLDNRELSELVGSATIGVIPGARWYQAPVKLYQYSSQGLAVVSIKTPTISYITQGNSGFTLFENSYELENVLLNFCEDPELLRKSSESARQFYNTHLGKQGYIRFFNDLLQDFNRS